MRAIINVFLDVQRSVSTGDARPRTAASARVAGTGKTAPVTVMRHTGALAADSHACVRTGANAILLLAPASVKKDTPAHAARTSVLLGPLARVVCKSVHVEPVGHVTQKLGNADAEKDSPEHSVTSPAARGSVLSDAPVRMGATASGSVCAPVLLDGRGQCVRSVVQWVGLG